MKVIKSYLRCLQDTYPLFTVMFCLSIILLIAFLFFQIKFYNSEVKAELDRSSIKVERIFTNMLDYSQDVINIMNSQIKKNPNDKKNINDVIQKYRTNPSIISSFPWTLFSWINKDNILTVDALYGIVKKPIDLSHRDYISLLKNNPNKLIIGAPVIGSTSKEWMIAGGVGVVDSKNNYIGAMTIGFKIKTLLSKLYSTIDSKFMDIILINKDLNIITKDGIINYIDYNFDISDKNLHKNLENFVNNNSSEFSNISLFDHSSSYKLSRLRNTNYSFVIKYNNLGISKKLWVTYFSRMAELLIIAFITSIMLVFVYKRERRHRYKITIANKNINKANNSKTRLINVVSHDIKNYAFAISGLARLILDKKSDSEIKLDDDLQLIEYIANHSDELKYFVSDLLDYQQRDSGNFTLGKLENCNIKRLIYRMILLNKNIALENKILVETDIQDNIPYLKCDIRRFKQILTNLITNAIKYSPAGKKVIITVKYPKETKQLYIEVSDEGFGMNEEELKMALSGDGKNIDKSSFNKEIDSNGIGLTIVKKLVEIHNGKLEIESKKGIGTKVKLYFNLDEAEDSQENHEISKNKNILFAEDNPINRKVICAILKNIDCNITCAKNGKEAIESLNNSPDNHYDLILIDIEMPIMNGIEAIKIIRKNDKLKHIPIITLTSNSNDRVLEEFGNNTTINHINKSSSKKEILDTIARVFEESSIES